MWRVLKYLSIALGVVLLAVAGFSVALRLRFSPSPPTVHYIAPKDALEAQRQDLDYLGKLLAMDISFSPEMRMEAARRLEAMREANAVLPRPSLRVALMRIAALSDNGHTGISADPGAQPMELPARVAGFSDGIYVMHATKPYADLLGGKVVAIDGHPIAEVIQRLMQLRGRRLWLAPSLCRNLYQPIGSLGWHGYFAQHAPIRLDRGDAVRRHHRRDAYALPAAGQ